MHRSVAGPSRRATASPRCTSCKGTQSVGPTRYPLQCPECRLTAHTGCHPSYPPAGRIISIKLKSVQEQDPTRLTVSWPCQICEAQTRRRFQPPSASTSLQLKGKGKGKEVTPDFLGGGRALRAANTTTHLLDNQTRRGTFRSVGSPTPSQYSEVGSEMEVEEEEEEDGFGRFPTSDTRGGDAIFSGHGQAYDSRGGGGGWEGGFGKERRESSLRGKEERARSYSEETEDEDYRARSDARADFLAMTQAPPNRMTSTPQIRHNTFTQLHPSPDYDAPFDDDLAGTSTSSIESHDTMIETPLNRSLADPSSTSLYIRDESPLHSHRGYSIPSSPEVSDGGLVKSKKPYTHAVGQFVSENIEDLNIPNEPLEEVELPLPTIATPLPLPSIRQHPSPIQTSPPNERRRTRALSHISDTDVEAFLHLPRKKYKPIRHTKTFEDGQCLWKHADGSPCVLAMLDRMLSPSSLCMATPQGVDITLGIAPSKHARRKPRRNMKLPVRDLGDDYDGIEILHTAPERAGPSRREGHSQRGLRGQRLGTAMRLLRAELASDSQGSMGGGHVPGIGETEVVDAAIARAEHMIDTENMGTLRRREEEDEVVEDQGMFQGEEGNMGGGVGIDGDADVPLPDWAVDHVELARLNAEDEDMMYDYGDDGGADLGKVMVMEEENALPSEFADSPAAMEGAGVVVESDEVVLQGVGELVFSDIEREVGLDDDEAHAVADVPALMEDQVLDRVDVGDVIMEDEDEVEVESEEAEAEEQEVQQTEREPHQSPLEGMTRDRAISITSSDLEAILDDEEEEIEEEEVEEIEERQQVDSMRTTDWAQKQVPVERTYPQPHVAPALDVLNQAPVRDILSDPSASTPKAQSLLSLPSTRPVLRGVAVIAAFYKTYIRPSQPSLMSQGTRVASPMGYSIGNRSLDE